MPEPLQNATPGAENGRQKPMDTPKKKRGRPRKDGVKEPWQFARSLMVLNAYNRARERGEKRSAAIKEAVDLVKQSAPEMPISVTEVKRILAEFHPKDSETGLIVRPSVPDAKEIARRHNLRAQVPGFAETKITAELPNQNLQKCRGFKFGFGKRPDYPRHNAIAPNS
jgi:hypothetical protein